MYTIVKPTLITTLATLVFVTVAAPRDATASTSDPTCAQRFASDSTYPPLPLPAIVDGQGLDGAILILESERGVLGLEGCLYEVDRTIEVNFHGLNFASLLIQLPDRVPGTLLYVTTEEGVLVEIIEIDAPSFEYTMPIGSALGFTIIEPGWPAPTVPVVVTKPLDDDPDPL